MKVAISPSWWASSLAAFLKLNAVSGPAIPRAGAEHDLPLRAGVLAVGGDDVDAELLAHSSTIRSTTGDQVFRTVLKMW